MAAQKVQKEAQATLEAVQDDLNVQRAENERLTGSLAELQTHAESLREQIQKETERAESLDRDLDAAIEAHAHVDAARLEAEAETRKQAAARASAEKDLVESRGLLDATVADAARLQERLSSVEAAAEQARAEAQSAREELRGERERGERLTTSLAEVQAQADILLADFAEAETQAEAMRAELADVHGQAEALRGEVSDARAQADALRHELADLHGRLDGLQTELHDARAQADTLRGDLQRETERADGLDRDLDAAIEAHANVDAARMEAEAECRRQTTAATAAGKELAEVRALLDASVAQASRVGMQLDANAAENGTLRADLSAAHAELDSAKLQREAISAQLDASRSRIQTLERNQAAQEEQLRHLESALTDAIDASDVLRAEVDARPAASEVDASSYHEVLADASALRDDVARMGSLLDASSQAVDELAEKTTLTDLFAALVRHLAAEFSRVALFRLKANRLEGEDQIGFDETTDVTKLVLPLNVDSLITRAASSGSFEQLIGGELADSSRAPFGGTPTVALAMPISFQGELLAVVYADSDQPVSERGPAGHDASIVFAKLMVRTAGVLVMRLSQELKMLNELRDYAAMLLQEAQEMHSADLEAEKSDDERRSRLKDTIDCARQLYAQRASLEGAAAATLFDDRIAVVIDSDGDSPFSRDLEAIASSANHGDSRRAAEAS